eukprot:scaffold34913_cov172-Amphora_coffeaeformis.AAC.2
MKWLQATRIWRVSKKKNNTRTRNAAFDVIDDVTTTPKTRDDDDDEDAVTMTTEATVAANHNNNENAKDTLSTVPTQTHETSKRRRAPAGIVSYAPLGTWRFRWLVSVPIVLLCGQVPYQFTGHFPDTNNQEDLSMLGARDVLDTFVYAIKHESNSWR